MPTNKDICEGAQDFVNCMLKQTIRLICETNEEAGPKLHSAAGVLVKSDDITYLLSVSHAVGKNEWFMEADYCDQNKTTLLFKLEEPVTFENVDLDKAEAEVALCNMDFSKLQDAMSEDARMANVKLPVYIGPLDCVPSEEFAYGFAKHNRDELHKDIQTMYTEPIYEIGMKYEGVTDSGLYRFGLEGKHKGDEIYKGCSGAPIAGDDGKIVALVESGCEEESVIYGVPISLYKLAMANQK